MLPKLIVGAVGLAAIYLYFIGREGGPGDSLPSDLSDGVQYTGTPETWTREQVSKWSKTMMIRYGFWDDSTNATTPAYHALPTKAGGF